MIAGVLPTAAPATALAVTPPATATADFSSLFDATLAGSVVAVPPLPTAPANIVAATPLPIVPQEAGEGEIAELPHVEAAPVHDHDAAAEHDRTGDSPPDPIIGVVVVPVQTVTPLLPPQVVVAPPPVRTGGDATDRIPRAPAAAAAPSSELTPSSLPTDPAVALQSPVPDLEAVATAVPEPALPRHSPDPEGRPPPERAEPPPIVALVSLSPPKPRNAPPADPTRAPSADPVVTPVAPPPASAAAPVATEPAPVRAPPPPAPVAMFEPPGFAVDTVALGGVSAELRGERDDRLHVHFAVERVATATVIVDGGGALDRALAAAGARLDTMSVEVRDARMSAGADSGGDPRREPAPRPHVPVPRAVIRARPAAAVAVSTDRFA